MTYLSHHLKLFILGKLNNNFRIFRIYISIIVSLKAYLKVKMFDEIFAFSYFQPGTHQYDATSNAPVVQF